MTHDTYVLVGTLVTSIANIFVSWRNSRRVKETRVEVVETQKKIEEKSEQTKEHVAKLVEKSDQHLADQDDKLNAIEIKINGNLDKLLRHARDEGFRDGLEAGTHIGVSDYIRNKESGPKPTDRE